MSKLIMGVVHVLEGRLRNAKDTDTCQRQNIKKILSLEDLNDTREYGGLLIQLTFTLRVKYKGFSPANDYCLLVCQSQSRKTKPHQQNVNTTISVKTKGGKYH